MTVSEKTRICDTMLVDSGDDSHDGNWHYMLFCDDGKGDTLLVELMGSTEEEVNERLLDFTEDAELVDAL